MPKINVPCTDPLKDWIGSWLECEHHGYLVDRVIDGTYGRVWILSHPAAYPRSFAAKSFRIQPESKDGDLNVQDLFEREIALWMRIPPHFNVLSALGVDLAPSPAGHDDRIPIVRMPKFDGSLRNWINGSPRQDEPNCLVGVAQFCNGLSWLYSHGVSGHGDLKPENVLLQDLRGQYELNDGNGFPSQRLPWRIAVADLGWANAWEALGLGDRAWRPYLAPERTDPGFDARRSDSFAVGVILAEGLRDFTP